MISLDTEDTGTDFHHGARPFLVTTCNTEGVVRFWEAEVDPLTREPQWELDSCAEIAEAIYDADTIVGQNLRFDAQALRAYGMTGTPSGEDTWPWDKTEDTLLAAHVLASNAPKSLDALTLTYLGHDISHFEKATEVAVKQCRQWARSNRPRWRIAKPSLPDMPSAKEKTWKSDLWLPRAVALEQKLPTPVTGCEHMWAPNHYCLWCRGHRWWVVTSEYANTDSVTTLLVWYKLKALLEERGYWKIYRAQMPLLPIIHDMEWRGLTFNGAAYDEQVSTFSQESLRLGERMVGIAAHRAYQLVLPRGGRNQSLNDFIFGYARPNPKTGKRDETLSRMHTVRTLNLITEKVTDSGAMSMDKHVLEEWRLSLPPGPALDFIKALEEKAGYDTALGYLASYRRFRLPLKDHPGFWVLHPSFNPTGTDGDMATTRFSSTNPNAQQLSKKKKANLRKCFGPEPGWEWWSMDYKNLELRIPAYKSGEKEMIELFEKGEVPPFWGSQHMLNFSIIYPDIWADAVAKHGDNAGPWIKSKEGYADTYYQWCKNGDFAIQYQCGDAKADQTFHKPGARALLRARFAKQDKLNREVCAFAEKHGYIETLPDRTVDPKHGYPLLCSRTEWGRVKPTVPLSYLVQGTAGWIARQAMIHCQRQLDDWGLGRLLIQCHDELVFRLPKAAHPVEDPEHSNLYYAKQLSAIMEQCGMNLIPPIPTPTGIEYHDTSWGEGVTIQ